MLALVDNTVLSNFALAGAIPLLREALGEDAAVVEAVLDEFATGITRGRLPSTDLTWIRVLTLNENEKTMYHTFRPQLGAGEAACLAVALSRGYSVLTDDRTARKVAAQHKIVASGTIGVLLLLVANDSISIQDGSTLLKRMIDAGYHSPVAGLAELI